MGIVNEYYRVKHITLHTTINTPTARSDSQSVALDSNRILIYGGEDKTIGAFYQDAYIYDHRDRTFESIDIKPLDCKAFYVKLQKEFEAKKFQFKSKQAFHGQEPLAEKEARYAIIECFNLTPELVRKQTYSFESCEDDTTPSTFCIKSNASVYAFMWEVSPKLDENLNLNDPQLLLNDHDLFHDDIHTTNAYGESIISFLEGIKMNHALSIRDFAPQQEPMRSRFYHLLYGGFYAPIPRKSGTIVYDAVHNVVFLIGGIFSNFLFDDIWVFHVAHGAWIAHFTFDHLKIPSCFGFAYYYDPETRLLVLSHGNKASFDYTFCKTNDLYEIQFGPHFTELPQVNKVFFHADEVPPPCYEPLFDTYQDHFLFFHGGHLKRSDTPFNQSWMYDVRRRRWERWGAPDQFEDSTIDYKTASMVVHDDHALIFRPFHYLLHAQYIPSKSWVTFPLFASPLKSILIEPHHPILKDLDFPSSNDAISLPCPSPSFQSDRHEFLPFISVLNPSTTHPIDSILPYSRYAFLRNPFSNCLFVWGGAKVSSVFLGDRPFNHLLTMELTDSTLDRFRSSLFSSSSHFVDVFVLFPSSSSCT